MTAQRLPSVRIAAAVAVLAAGVLAGGCDEEETAGPEAGFTIEDIVSDPGETIGQEVAVSAEVGDVFRPYAFTLESGDTESVLVVSEDPVEVVENSVVRAIGVVVEPPVDAEEASPEVAAFVQETVGADYRHAIVASEVQRLEEPGQLETER